MNRIVSLVVLASFVSSTTVLAKTNYHQDQQTSTMPSESVKGPQELTKAEADELLRALKEELAKGEEAERTALKESYDSVDKMMEELNADGKIQIDNLIIAGSPEPTSNTAPVIVIGLKKPLDVAYAKTSFSNELKKELILNSKVAIKHSLMGARDAILNLLPEIYYQISDSSQAVYVLVSGEDDLPFEPKSSIFRLVLQNGVKAPIVLGSEVLSVIKSGDPKQIFHLIGGTAATIFIPVNKLNSALKTAKVRAAAKSKNPTNLKMANNENTTGQAVEQVAQKSALPSTEVELLKRAENIAKSRGELKALQDQSAQLAKVAQEKSTTAATASALAAKETAEAVKAQAVLKNAQNAHKAIESKLLNADKELAESLNGQLLKAQSNLKNAEAVAVKESAEAATQQARALEASKSASQAAKDLELVKSLQGKVDKLTGGESSATTTVVKPTVDPKKPLALKSLHGTTQVNPKTGVPENFNVIK
ncbi:MAG: hypothetical protein SGI74_06350 [Oligoflexia bacterium]|nr:hypothetical protein [Oligoflexia bacterium]